MGTIAVILDTESSSAAYVDANTDDTENITCFLLSKHNPSPLVLNIAKVQKNTSKMCPLHSSYPEEARSTKVQAQNTTEQYRSQTHKDQTTEPLMYTLQVSTLVTNQGQNTTQPNSYTIHIVSSAVGALVASLVVGLLLKKCLQRKGNNIELMDAHVWTLPHGRAGPGLFRSASLPDMTSACLTVPDDPASCRALLAILQHSYCEIPDNIAAAQRPLPVLPHTYCEIPNHIAAAQRPLPALPPTYDEIPDNIAAQRPLSAPSHTYWEIPDHAVCSMARPAVCNTRLTASCKSLPAALYFVQASKRSTPPIGHESGTSKRAAAYGMPGKARNDSNSIPPIGHEFGTSKRAAAYGVLGKAKHNSASMYSPWNVTEKGSQIIARPRSFPVLPNTYWPWLLPGKEPHNTQCQKPSAPFLPNTYWPWEIPVKTIQTPKRRRWSMPEEGLQNL
ncbi:hypothetical protein Bbelb_387960 [Branchiostoma belcheri]|nr:hypothetical protein Bbelb_387960 [Branchiostoma belcheri]